MLAGHRDVEREQPHRGGVDGHGCVGRRQVQIGQQRAGIAQVGHGYPDPTDLTSGQRVVRVVPGLRRQVEGDAQAGLTLGQVAPEQRVARGGRRVPGVGAHHPRPVALAQADALGATRTDHLVSPLPPGTASFESTRNAR